MASSAHFQRMSQQFYNFLQDGFLTDTRIETMDKPVELHKLIFTIFSAHTQSIQEKTNCVCEVKASSFTSAAVTSLVEYLYLGNTDGSGKVVDLVKTLKLDLSVDKQIHKKKIQKGESIQKLISLEMKYLRNLTFQIEIPKLLKTPRMLADVYIVTGRTHHKCHKLILSATSLYFRAMFSSGMKETDMATIQLQGVDSDTFLHSLQYMYTGKLDISVENAQDLLATSVYLQMEAMQTECEEFLMQKMDFNNSVDMWSLATAYNCLALADGAWNFIVHKFDKIPKLHLLRGLKHVDMLKLLVDDNLCVNEEIDVFKFILDWIPHHKTSEKLSELLKTVRLALIDVQQLEEIADKILRVYKTKACIDFIHSAVQQKKNECQKEVGEAQPRKEKVFIVIKRSSCTSGIEVGCYSAAQKKWYRLQHNTHCDGGTGYASCVGKGSIYITGGLSTPCSIFQFSADENKWRQLPDMKDARTSHGAAYVNDFIYVFGGSDISKGALDVVSSIEKYDIHHQTWKAVGKMEIPTYDSAYVVCKARIYIFGGAITAMPGVFIKDIQCIDTISDTSSILYHNLPFTLSLGVACINNRDMYISCANGMMIHYKEDETPVTINNTKSCQHMGFATLYNENAVYVLGGDSLLGESDVIKRFDLKTMKETTYPTKLPFARQSNQLFATVMHVSRKFLQSEYTVDKARATNW